jgi:hypothetical protein
MESRAWCEFGAPGARHGFGARETNLRAILRKSSARVGVEYRGERYLIGVGFARQPGRDAFRLNLSFGPMWYDTLRFIRES